MGLFTGGNSNPFVASAAKQSQQQFYTSAAQASQQYATAMGAESAISDMWAPVVKTGAIPYGYSPELDSLLKANAIDTAAVGTTNALNASDLSQRQMMGGATGPSGASEVAHADILARGQQSEAEGLRNEKIAGYQQGVTNLEGATTAESDVAKTAEEGAASSGSLASDANKNQLAAGEAQWQEQQTGGILSGINAIAGTVGNVAKTAMGIGDAASMFTKSLSSRGGGSSADANEDAEGAFLQGGGSFGSS